MNVQQAHFLIDDAALQCCSPHLCVTASSDHVVDERHRQLPQHVRQAAPEHALAARARSRGTRRCREGQLQRPGDGGGSRWRLLLSAVCVAGRQRLAELLFRRADGQQRCLQPLNMGSL